MIISRKKIISVMSLLLFSAISLISDNIVLIYHPAEFGCYYTGLLMDISLRISETGNEKNYSEILNLRRMSPEMLTQDIINICKSHKRNQGRWLSLICFGNNSAYWTFRSLENIPEKMRSKINKIIAFDSENNFRLNIPEWLCEKNSIYSWDIFYKTHSRLRQKAERLVNSNNSSTDKKNIKKPKKTSKKLFSKLRKKNKPKKVKRKPTEEESIIRRGIINGFAKIFVHMLYSELEENWYN